MPRPIERNRIYTVTLRKDVTDTDVSLQVEAWGDGGDTGLYPDTDSPLRIDESRSTIPADVQVADGGPDASAALYLYGGAGDGRGATASWRWLRWRSSR